MLCANCRDAFVQRLPNMIAKFGLPAVTYVKLCADSIFKAYCKPCVSLSTRSEEG